MNKYFKDLDYKLLDRKTVYKGKRITVEELHFFNPRAGQTLYREHVLAGNAVVVMPVTKDNKLVMIQEPRTPIGKIVLTFPAGMIEDGENSEEAAARELEEETGYKAGTLKKMRVEYPTIGYSNEYITIYLAKDLIKTKMHLDETEDIKVIELPIDEVKVMLDKNEIITSSETIALMHYFTYEKQNK